MYGNMAERSKALESGSLCRIQSERAWVRIPLLSNLFPRHVFEILCTTSYAKSFDCRLASWHLASPKVNTVTETEAYKEKYLYLRQAPVLGSQTCGQSRQTKSA